MGSVFILFYFNFNKYLFEKLNYELYQKAWAFLMRKDSVATLVVAYRI